MSASKELREARSKLTTAEQEVEALRARITGLRRLVTDLVEDQRPVKAVPGFTLGRELTIEDIWIAFERGMLEVATYHAAKCGAHSVPPGLFWQGPDAYVKLLIERESPRPPEPLPAPAPESKGE